MSRTGQHNEVPWRLHLCVGPVPPLRGAELNGPYPQRLTLDVDSLDPAHREALEALLREPAGPHGQIWHPTTPPLVKLVAWASWAHHLAEIDVEPTAEQLTVMQFHPDGLHVGDWAIVRCIEADPASPDGRLWNDEATLVKLVAWAECGYFLLGGRSNS